MFKFGEISMCIYLAGKTFPHPQYLDLEDPGRAGALKIKNKIKIKVVT